MAYFLFYKEKNDAVSLKIGLQVQVNNGISQSFVDDHNNDQNHNDVVSSNKQQDMWVNENVIQVDGTNICNQGVIEEIIRITNADCSSANNNNANVNPRAQQTSWTVIDVDDDDPNTDDADLLMCALCLETKNSDRDRGLLIQMDNANAKIPIITILENSTVFPA